MAGCSISIRFSIFFMAVIMAVNNGYLPSASYAFAANNEKRWIRLTVHASWICFAWSLVLTILSFCCPKQIASIFTNDKNVIEISGQMIKIQNAVGIITWVKNIAQSILQSMQNGVKAVILSLSTQLISIILFEIILFYTDSHNPIRLLWAYPLSFAFGFIMAIFFLWSPLKQIYNNCKKKKISKSDKIDSS